MTKKNFFVDYLWIYLFIYLFIYFYWFNDLLSSLVHGQLNIILHSYIDDITWKIVLKLNSHYSYTIGQIVATDGAFWIQNDLFRLRIRVYDL